MIKNNLSDVQKATLIFNLVLDMVPALISQKDSEFDRAYCNVTNEYLSNLAYKYRNAFSPSVSTYRPWNVFSSALATTYSGNYSYIGLNKFKINRSVPSLCGSIAHEWGHCFEYFIGDKLAVNAKFNHGDNDPNGKDNTFQYWLGRVVKGIVEEDLDGFLRKIGC